MLDTLMQKIPILSRNVNIVVISLFIFAISAVCFWSFQSNNSHAVGRYQFFVKDNNVFSYVYILDTKTSRLFLRSIFDTDTRASRLFRQLPEGRAICLDFGTVNQPLNPRIEEYIAKQNRWEDTPTTGFESAYRRARGERPLEGVSEPPTSDIFDKIAAQLKKDELISQEKPIRLSDLPTEQVQP